MDDFERKFSDAQQQAQPNVVKLEDAALTSSGEDHWRNCEPD
jgi:hypothetical protein